MAAISQTIFSDASYWIKSSILLNISTEFVPKTPIDNKNLALV